MSAARIIVLIVALVAGLGAAILAGSSRAPAPQPVAEKAPTSAVLVAASDIPMGTAVTAGALRWQPWPADAVNGQYISQAANPNAIDEFTGSIARTPFVQGEPIRAEKLIKTDGSGFMSAILTPGMRAVSTEISPETGAGGFILPNDRVDVVLSRRITTGSGPDEFSSETVLSNIRVLAIDQTVEDKGGEKVITGKTATLELTPGQTEVLALSKQLGTLSLALRPLADARSGKSEPEIEKRTGGITVVRYGVSQQISTR